MLFDQIDGLIAKPVRLDPRGVRIYLRFSPIPARKAAIADSCCWPIQELISENKTPKIRGVGGF